MNDRLSRRFLAAVAQAHGASLPDTVVPADLGVRLAALAAEGTARWPDLSLSDEEFVVALARLAPSASDQPLALALALALAAWLDSLRGAELFLATACANGSSRALEAFDREFLSTLPAALSRLRPPTGFVDEVTQVVRERLLVAAPGRRPRIADYSGTGSLAGWLRVTAMRVAINLQKQRREEQLPGGEEGGYEERPAPGGHGADPELDILKRKYKAQFEDALRAALAQLTGEQRNLLVLHFVDGLTLEQVAALLNVHRATAVRWIAAAREAVLEHANALLRERLGLSPPELLSLTRLVQSQLDFSIVEHLRAPPRRP